MFSHKIAYRRDNKSGQYKEDSRVYFVFDEIRQHTKQLPQIVVCRYVKSDLETLNNEHKYYIPLNQFISDDFIVIKDLMPL